jgi:hypothetical protein
MNYQEARAAFAAHQPRLQRMGVTLEGVKTYVPEEWQYDWNMAMDALPELIGMDALPTAVTSPNSAVPMMLTTMIDPSVIKVLFAPNKAAAIFDEVKKGTWLDETMMFPMVEHLGEVSSYGDYANAGRAGVNTNWPQRQAYLFQAIKQYGDRELERAGLAKINWVTEMDQAAVTVMNKYSNYAYFFGVLGLQNYGLLNDPQLTASLAPASKAYGGTRWVVGGVVQATANEIFTDIQSMFYQMQVQTLGVVDAETKMCLAMHPAVAVALTATNTYNVNVYDLLKKNFPNISFETAVQYGVITASNPQGLAAGNAVQLIADEVEGQDVGYCAYNEKLKSFPVVRLMSAYEQKIAGGVWGAIVRFPAGIVTMIGL